MIEPLGPLSFRLARLADLPALVALYAADPLGQTREGPLNPLNQAYLEAFKVMEADPHQRLIVAELGDQLVGTLQLTFITGLARRGAKRGQIEAVRIAPAYRQRGYGKLLISHAIEECRVQKCALVQLMSDKTRPEAHKFYGALGFSPSHEGFKLSL